jgi:hypothetical protein
MTTGMLVVIAFIFLLLIPYLKTDLKPASVLMVLFLLLFACLSLALRMAYVSRALFPSYFDSAQHYALIKYILAGGSQQVFETLGISYYHLGFHFLAAFFASIFKAAITTTMLILGQVILAVLPFPYFYIVRYMTRSDWAGMLAVVLSAFGWYMPAHAVDWGKYPALMSLGLIPIVCGLAYLLSLKATTFSVQKRWSLYGMLGVAVFLTTFVHSRSLIVLGIVALAWSLSRKWGRLPQGPKHSIFLLLLVILFLGIFFIQRQDILSLLFDPYLSKGIWTTSLVVFLSVFAYKSYPRLMFTNLLAVCLLLAGLFVPVTGLVPGRPQLTLMDRPYLEMLLFMPLSLLGGLGLAGLEKWIKGSYRRYAILAGIALILVHGVINYEFYPSDCCVLVGNDDAVAMAWMDEQLAVGARVGIASTELRVLAADVAEGYVGTDAGIWVTPLTGRQTVALPHDVEFDRPGILDLLCTNGLGYLFVGELGQSFEITRLDSRPEWYRPLLSMQKTRVYEVSGCGS